MAYTSIYDILKQALVKSLLVSSTIAFVSICAYTFYHHKQTNVEVEQTINSKISAKNADLVTAFMLGNYEGLEAIIEKSLEGRPVRCWDLVFANAQTPLKRCDSVKSSDLKKLSITSGGLHVGDLYYTLTSTFNVKLLVYRSVLIFISIVFSISIASLVVLSSIRKKILMPLIEVKNSIKDGSQVQNVGNCAEIAQLNEEIVRFRLIAARNEELQKHSAIAKTVQTIAHDLKSPINVINMTLNCLSWSEFLKRKAITTSAMLRLQSMVDSFKNADLESVVKQNWGIIPWNAIICEMSAIADEKGVILHPKSIYDQITYVDIPKIERVIINLVKNAIESDANNVWLSAVVNGTDLAIEVKDDGSGVPHEFVSQLFIKGKTINKKDGTGLGLSFVKETANGHGGDAQYERRDNFSIFRVTLPCAIKDDVVKKERSMQVINTTLIQVPAGAELSKNEEAFTENNKREVFSKITVKLIDSQLESKVIEVLAQKYPDVKIDCFLDNSDFLWSNDRHLIKDAILKKVPLHMLNDRDRFESIVQTISGKLQHFT